jgi:Cu/Ag efflux pump CusA
MPRYVASPIMRSRPQRRPRAAHDSTPLYFERHPMNAIVLVALRRPLTFVVMSILIVLFGGMAVLRTPTDIFPNIRIPVVAVVWTYNGLTPQDMSGRVIYYYERSLTSTVENIEHIESQSLYGRGIVKVFLHSSRCPLASRHRRSFRITPPRCRCWTCRCRRPA